MKKQIMIAINGVAFVRVVETIEELRALDLTIAASVDIYNNIIDADHQVKKFTDKNVAAKRLFAILPEVVEVSYTPAKTSSVKSVLRGLFTDSAAAYTLEQLLEATGTTYKVLHDEMSRLKNPKYAGKTGTLVITRNADGLYGVSL